MFAGGGGNEEHFLGLPMLISKHWGRLSPGITTSVIKEITACKYFRKRHLFWCLLCECTWMNCKQLSTPSGCDGNGLLVTLLLRVPEWWPWFYLWSLLGLTQVHICNSKQGGSRAPHRPCPRSWKLANLILSPWLWKVASLNSYVLPSDPCFLVLRVCMNRICQIEK